MYYHVLVNTKERGNKGYYELDQKSLEDIVENIILPYVKGERFQVDGYFVDTPSVQRLLVTKSDKPSDYYYQIERARDRDSGIAVFGISKGFYVTQKDEYFADITREAITYAKEVVRQSTDITNNQVTSPKPTLFLAYSYRPKEEDMVKEFRDLLEGKGYRVLDGKPDRLGSLSKAILDKIESSDIVIIVMTKRDKKDNGFFTISSWLIEEKAVAKALGKEIAIFVEEGVDPQDIGGLQGDDQRFNFTDGSFKNEIQAFIDILEKR